MIDLQHPLAVLATRLSWASIEAAVAPKLVHLAKPAKRVAGIDLVGSFEGLQKAATSRLLKCLMGF